MKNTLLRRLIPLTFKFICHLVLYLDIKSIMAIKWLWFSRFHDGDGNKQLEFILQSLSIRPNILSTIINDFSTKLSKPNKPTFHWWKMHYALSKKMSFLPFILFVRQYKRWKSFSRSFIFVCRLKWYSKCWQCVSFL